MGNNINNVRRKVRDESAPANVRPATTNVRPATTTSFLPTPANDVPTTAVAWNDDVSTAVAITRYDVPTSTSHVRTARIRWCSRVTSSANQR
mgnify:CR=1 FL=1